MSKPYKIPQSVLVVIYTPARDVLLLRRTDPAEPAFWQSVTGSKDAGDEPFAHTAAREVWEETGIVCRTGTALHAQLQDWQLENVYAIYPRWAHRYAPDITHNTERVYGLQVPQGIPVRLSPQEHSAYQWLPWREAQAMCFSGSNAQAIGRLSRLEPFGAANSAERAQAAIILEARDEA